MNIVAFVCVVVIIAPLGCRFMRALKYGPKDLLQTGMFIRTPGNTGKKNRKCSFVHKMPLMASGSFQQQPAAVLTPLAGFHLPGRESIGASVFRPLRLIPGCTLRIGHPGWPSASPWQAGTPPGLGASLWWSPSSAHRPVSTPGRRWNFDRMELLSVPAGKTPSRGGGEFIYSQRLEGKNTDVREGSTYSKHSSHDPPMVLSQGLSICIIWTEKPTKPLAFRDLFVCRCCWHAYLALPGCLVVLRWPLTGTPWGTWGLDGATAEPPWQSCAPGRRCSGLHAARWTGAWESSRDPTSVSGEFSTWCRDRVECHYGWRTSGGRTLSILTTGQFSWRVKFI